MSAARITAITPASGKRDTYDIRFDDDSLLKASGGVVLTFGLYAGMSLDETALAALKAELEKQRVRARAAAMIGARPLSEHELKKRLVERGGSEENAEDAASWLRELGALDDARYAAALVRSYAAKGYGRAKIKDEFYKRGIARELWDEALAAYEAPEERIDRFVMAKLKGTAPDRKALKKTADALYRRGFSWDEIRDALARYEYDEQDTVL